MIRQAIELKEDVPILLSFVLSFLDYTIIALIYGYSNTRYPAVKIHLHDGTSISGQLLKMGKDIIILLRNPDSKMFIPKENVVYLEIHLERR